MLEENKWYSLFFSNGLLKILLELFSNGRLLLLFSVDLNFLVNNSLNIYSWFETIFKVQTVWRPNLYKNCNLDAIERNFYSGSYLFVFLRFFSIRSFLAFSDEKIVDRIFFMKIGRTFIFCTLYWKRSWTGFEIFMSFE